MPTVQNHCIVSISGSHEHCFDAVKLYSIAWQQCGYNTVKTKTTVADDNVSSKNIWKSPPTYYGSSPPPLTVHVGELAADCAQDRFRGARVPLLAAGRREDVCVRLPLNHTQYLNSVDGL